MSAFDSSEHPRSTEPEPSLTPPSAHAIDQRPRPFNWSARRWVPILGIVLLTLGTGFGWRWWQTSRVEAQPKTAAQARSFPVKLETTRTSTIPEYSEFVGSLESRRSVILKPEITGRIGEILVKAGDRVTTGTPLIQLRPEKRAAQFASVLAGVNLARAGRANAMSQLQALQADRVASVAELDLQNDQYRRTSALVKEGALPQQQLDQVTRDRRKAVAQLDAIDQRIQASRANLVESDAGLQQANANANLADEQLQDTTIVAPFDGIVGDIPVRVGQIVGTDDLLTTVTQNQELEMRLSIPLERSPNLKLGQRVELTDAAGTVLSIGRMSFISPKVNAQGQSILAKATFNSPKGQLRDGQFVRARVIWQEQPGILISTAAISRLGGQTFVYVAQPTDKPTVQGQPPALIAKQKPVKLGRIQGNQYQVLEGLQLGEQVIVSGVLNLTDGALVKPQTTTQ